MPEENEGETKEAESKEAEAQPKEAESKEVESKETETKKTESKEPEQKEPEQKEPQTKEPEQKEPEQKEPEQKEPEQKPPEQKEPEQKPPEPKQPEQKQPEPIKPETKEPEPKKPEPKEPESKDAKESREKGDGDNIKTPELKQTSSKISRTASLAKKKLASKSFISSKASLKKATESNISTISEPSSTSLGYKRQSELEKLAKGPRYQNTYRLDSKKPFKPDEVYKILEEAVTKEVENWINYDPSTGSKIVQTIAAEVRTNVKNLHYDRYKICVLVFLGEKKLHGYQAAFRALWDSERDGWITYFYQTRTYFLSCTCYGLYHD